jgi:hypothetical protein
LVGSSPLILPNIVLTNVRGRDKDAHLSLKLINQNVPLHAVPYSMELHPAPDKPEKNANETTIFNTP